MVKVNPAEMAALTVEFFNRAAEEPELSERMSFAQTTVQIHFVDGEADAACTVWLDRTPISAESGLVGEAEIEMFGPAEAWMNMISGSEQLAMTIARGEVTYTGPVRKFLRVVPILRTFDFEMWRHEEPPVANGLHSVDGPAA
jgi:hypothetical protein